MADKQKEAPSLGAKYLWYSASQAAYRDKPFNIGKLGTGEFVIYTEMSCDMGYRPNWEDAVFLGWGDWSHVEGQIPPKEEDHD
ncbi:hypothetical protein [Candidatus Magnetobacterium casense]|uniref:Uncharacterized protein n=1 Tax=Candidatus Magnetobacterium casense TaxID=1455061 RepID=A0ABS6S3A1_9BACT|nr:hypothetical protein [Candidatus Magnetobacterium casensis]MBV6343339.1 hypothetical protein [Candidatus Magnetobacterium casensis]